MHDPAKNAEAPAPRVLSERVALASAALEAALAVPGVAGADAGPLGVHLTGAGGGERLEGVICAATEGGGYVLSLRLICDVVPLRPLADEIRAAVQTSAANGGASGALEA